MVAAVEAASVDCFWCEELALCNAAKGSALVGLQKNAAMSYCSARECARSLREAAGMELASGM